MLKQSHVSRVPQSGVARSPRIAALSFFILGALALSGSQAFALGVGNWGPHVAYTKVADADDGNYLIGGHLEMMLAPILGIQGAVDYRSAEPFGDTIYPDAVKVRSIPITATARIYLPTPAFSPFLGLGAGWYHVKYDYSEQIEDQLGFKDENVSTFGWHLGGGAKIPISPRFSLGGEARYTFVDPDRDLNNEVGDSIRDFDYDSFYLVGALNIEF